MRRTAPLAHRTTRLLVGLLAAGSAFAAAAPADAAAGKAYPARVEKGFVSACTASARTSAPKLSANGITAYCVCLLGAFETRYTYAQFQAMDKAANEGKKLTAAQLAYADQVTRACASRVR